MTHQMVALRPKRFRRSRAVPTEFVSANQNFPDRTNRMISLAIALRYFAACERGPRVGISGPPCARTEQDDLSPVAFCESEDREL